MFYSLKPGLRRATSLFSRRAASSTSSFSYRRSMAFSRSTFTSRVSPIFRPDSPSGTTSAVTATQASRRLKNCWRI
jgi:hypothetical protein